MNKKIFKKAFTLVEMLIVVIIIGILMGALLPKLTGAQAKARDTARQMSLGQISTALTMYFNDKGKYPNGNCTSDLSNNNDFKRYMPEVPKDPQGKRKTYGTQNTCKGTFGYTAMKNKNAKDAAYVLISNSENFGKSMNFILSGNTYFSGGNDLKNEINHKCTIVNGNNTNNNTYCSSSNQEGRLYEKYVGSGVYVIMGG